MGNNYIEQKSLVPVISKAKFDDVAAEFLGDYYPELSRSLSKADACSYCGYC